MNVVRSGEETGSASTNAGVSSAFIRMYSPTGPMSMPNANGTRQPQDSSEPWDRNVLRPNPNADARNMAAPCVATCQLV